ncbi:glucan biosynthesis protein [Parasedimentitalea psychrophila]|uniref:Glucan biosynthesis protein G n=1 Tax=Parasedimentitalea psychrophila TaxID=2997337 RepID=A0A9Y2P4G7_9RHOB|nr:glucan biosynthesis protein G [Parasedimentitalea psychrophila]WIY25304.1 glucan biosynthesis protein G [Parasedimentitalea psychrophila]
MTSFSRRSFLASAMASTSILAFPAQASDVPPFSRDTVISLARELAAHDYAPRASVPQDWLDMSYQDYQTRWFRNRDALWSDTDRSYNVDFFLPGLYFPRPVQVNTVTDSNGAERVPFDLSLFDKTDKAPALSFDDSLGYSGLRLRTELSQPNLKNEFCVYQGASYFRAIGLDNVYGLSARGLALKTGDPMGEEFPEFIEFWLEAPAPGQRNIVLHALLDSPSVAGAYRFDILPGDNCTMAVQATLFPRQELSHVGLGPLTSMFLFDQTNSSRFDDFRPAVHDSDGLLVQNGHGEVLWRPLANPRHLQISSFVDENPRGFGLMQRARKFSDFADLEASYHKRPCLWVEPDGNWGKGAVTLVEIPADQEIYDNIVAYWRPQVPYAAGDQVSLSYHLTWGHEPDLQLPRVINTAAGARVFGNPGRIMTLDFAAHPLLSDGPGGIDVHISSPHVDTSSGVLQRNPETGGLRLAFSFDPGARDLVELRAQLRKDGQMASEVWLYRWTA